MLRKICLGATLTLAVFLSGCNLSGTGTSASTSTPTTSSVVVGGKAAKGILQQAQVIVSVVENGATREIGRTLTDDQGNFSFDFGGITEPVLIQVVPQGNGDSQMICDAAGGCGATAFGQPMALPSDFSLTALYAPGELDSSIPITVTPLTHLAAQWALQLPGTLTTQVIQMTRDRVAALFGLDPGFVFQHIPDVTSVADMSAASDSARRYALLAAAFEQMAQNSGTSLKDLFNNYITALVNNAGQLPQLGSGNSLHDLFNALSTLVATLQTNSSEPDLSGFASSIANVLASLGSSVSTVKSGAPFDQATFDKAMVPLNDLDHYLTMAGIDSSGTFLKNQAPQVNWLYTPEMLGLVQTTLNTAMTTVVASIMSTLIPSISIPGVSTPCIDVSSELNMPGMSASYCPDTRVLTVTGTSNGQTANITIQIPNMLSGINAGALDFAANGTITNATATGSLNGTLHIDLYDTPLSSLVSAVQKVIVDGTATQQDTQALLDAVSSVISNLHVKAAIDGSGSLVSVADSSQRFDGAINAWGEVNVPAVTSGGTMLALQINSGSLVSPAGDTIFSLPGSSDTDPALAVQVGSDAHMTANFGTHAFGMPEMHFYADGTLGGVASVVTQLVQQLQGADLSSLNLSSITSLLQSLNLSALALNGQGSIDIPDDAKKYTFNLTGNRMDVSLPNSVDNALSVYLTAVNGGYLYSGDMLVGTFTIDWNNLGLTLNLVDGTSRTYALGPVTDIVDPSVIQALLGFLPSGSSYTF